MLGVASQVDELDPVRRPPADKLPVIEQARTILHSRMEECLRPLFEQVSPSPRNELSCYRSSGVLCNCIWLPGGEREH